MPLFLCSLCGKVYDPATVTGNKGICHECKNNLDNMYVQIHRVFTRRGEIDSINLQDIAEEAEMNLEDVKLLYELGYFERDMQTYCRIPSARQELAREFNREVDVLREHKKITTYSGTIYKRKNTNSMGGRS